MHRTALKLLCMWLCLCLFAPSRALSAARSDQPPRFEVPAPGAAAASLVFVVYGDTRFSRRDDVANAPARRALVGRIARENPAAIPRYRSRNAGALRARVVVVGSHVHNYERYERDGVTYLVSGGGGAQPVPALRMFGELSRLTTAVNFHYLRFTLDAERLTGTMVRFDAADRSG